MTSKQAYTSPFTHWHESSSVRTSRPRILSTSAGSFWPPELAPVKMHPRVRGADQSLTPKIEILLLLDDLVRTDEVETAVIPVTMDIANGQFAAIVPESARRDANYVLTDEAFHKTFCGDFIQQVRDATGISPVSGSGVLSSLENKLASLASHHRELARILFVVVTETSISPKLARIPADDRVLPAIRDLYADHVSDERRHQTYFLRLFRCIWRELSPADRRSYGPLMADFMRLFWTPDCEALTAILVSAGVSLGDAEIAVTETYSEHAIAAGIRVAAASTMRLFSSAGVLDDPQIRESFEYAMLLSPEGT